MKRWWLILIMTAAAAYIAVSPRYPVGLAIDDALYINAARSLLHGAYSNLALPGHPPLIDPLPGYPLLLAPFVAIVQPHWVFLKALSILLMLVTVALFRDLWRPWMTEPQAWIAAMLFALNSTTVNMAGIVVSEPAFTLVSVLVILVLRRALKGQDMRWICVLGLLVGWGSIIRPQGFVLLVAIVAAAAYARRWRTVLISGGIGMVLLSGTLLRNVIVSGHSSGYTQHWSATLPSLLTEPMLLVNNIGGVLKTFVFENLLNVNSSLLGNTAFIVILMVSGVMLWGARSTTQKRERRAEALAMGLLVSLFLGIHCFWLAVDSHYFLSITPFVIGWLVLGMTFFMERYGLRPLFVGILLCLTGRYVYCDLWAIPSKDQPAFRIPMRTYAWMKNDLPLQAVTYSPAAPTAALYSEHAARYALPARDAETWLAQLLQQRVTHVLSQPLNLQGFARYAGSSLDSNIHWQIVEAWAADWSAVFHPIFQDAAEGTTLYEVLAPPNYEQAYTLYRQGLADLEHNDTDKGSRELRQALRWVPAFPGALNALAASLLLSGHHLAEAERAARQALVLRPHEPLILLNLARIERRLGKRQAARHALDGAQQALEHVPFDPRLLEAVISEKSAL